LPKPFSPARHRAAPRKKIAKPTLSAAGNTPGTPRKKTIAAGPRVAAPRRSRKAEPSALQRLQLVIVGSLEDDKAENVVTLDLEGKASFCDRMVIATGLADRQITAMAEHLSEKLHEAGLKRVQVEGSNGADWVLIDAGDIVVHLF
jgi:ribosome-associated protein